MRGLIKILMSYCISIFALLLPISVLAAPVVLAPGRPAAYLYFPPVNAATNANTLDYSSYGNIQDTWDNLGQVIVASSNPGSFISAPKMKQIWWNVSRNNPNYLNVAEMYVWQASTTAKVRVFPYSNRTFGGSDGPLGYYDAVTSPSGLYNAECSGADASPPGGFCDRLFDHWPVWGDYHSLTIGSGAGSYFAMDLPVADNINTCKVQILALKDSAEGAIVLLNFIDQYGETVRSTARDPYGNIDNAGGGNNTAPGQIVVTGFYGEQDRYGYFNFNVPSDFINSTACNF